LRVDRLEKLAIYLLHDVPEAGFDMSSWGQTGFAEGECGATACALGWATRCFPGEGLRMVARDGGATVSYDGEYAYDAARRFFEIPYRHAAKLFSAPGTTEDVAHRLLAYLRDPDRLYRELREASQAALARGEPSRFPSRSP
jgi:hypothetical protein